MSKQQDIREATKLNIAFKEAVKDHLSLTTHKDTHFQNFLGHGAQALYITELAIPQMNARTARKCGVIGGSNIRAMIWVTSDINPNGVTGPHDIARTYTINCEFRGHKRQTFKTWNDTTFIKYHNYARDIETAVNDFKDWLLSDYAYFKRAIENKTYDYKTQY